MATVLLDVAGEGQWSSADGVVSVDLSSSRFWTEGSDESVVIDARGHHDAGVALLGRIPLHVRVRGLITDREAPEDHHDAYLAGATRIHVAGRGAHDPHALLEAFSED